MSDAPRVSVIIPVYDDPEGLRACLAALSRQSYPRDRTEILVVDNGSREDLSSVTCVFEGTQLLRENRPGSYRARNRGLAEATGDVVAFLDADCVPDPDWLSRGVEALLGGEEIGLAVGRVDLSFRDPEHLSAVEVHESVCAFPQERYARSNFGATANVFTKRRVAEKVGGFDSSLRSGGDKEWGQRIHAHGFEVVYAPDARVVHPARSTWRGFERKIFRCVCGDLDRARTEGVPTGRILARELWALRPPVLACFRVWRDPELPGTRRKLQFLATLVFSRLVRGRAVVHWLRSGESPR